MEKNILPAAKRMAENDNWTLERLKENLKDTIDTQKKFLAKEIPPRKIIGTGYKAGQSRRIATKYLEDRIAEYEQAIELKEKPKNSKRVKDYSYIKRSDISVLKATIDGKVLNVDPKDILSGTYVAGKIKPTAKKLRVAKIDASKLREKILKTYKDFAEEEYDKAYEPLIRVEDLKQFIEYGLTEEMIMVFYCGWKSIMKVAIDGEFTFGKAGGIFDLRTEGDYIKNHILRALKNCENNTFELGFKYPQLNWEKYGIKNPKTDIIDSAPYDFFGKKKQPILRIETFTLKPNFKLLAVKDVGEVVDSKRVAKYGEDDLIDSTKPMDLNYGYLCLVSRNLKEIFALAKKIIGDKDGYVKDFDWLVQEKTWGGEMLEESNYKFKKGGTLETVKNNADKYLKKHGINIYIEQKQELAKDLSNLNRDERYYVIYNDSIEAVEVIDQKFFDVFRGKTQSVVGSKSFTILSDYINGKRTPRMPHVYSMEHYVQKANLGALVAASKLAPKSVVALDEKISDRVSQKTFMDKMRETGSHKYAKGGEIKNHSDIVNLIEDSNTYMTLYDEVEKDLIMYSTRENGDIGEELASDKDVDEAIRLKRIVESKFNNVAVEVEEVDEWVHLNIRPIQKATYRYNFHKHSTPSVRSRGFTETYDTMNEMIKKRGTFVGGVNWEKVKKELENIIEYPNNKFTGWYDSEPILISKPSDNGNDWGYFFSVSKSENKNEYSKGGSTYAKGGSTQVAETIANQLGGTGRLKAFTGAYNFGTNGSNLFFRIKNRKVNYVKITLNGKDLYDIEFGRIYGSKYNVVKEYNDIYFDQLVPLFEENTGMYLKFAKGGEVDAYSTPIEQVAPNVLIATKKPKEVYLTKELKGDMYEVVTTPLNGSKSYKFKKGTKVMVVASVFQYKNKKGKNRFNKETFAKGGEVDFDPIAYAKNAGKDAIDWMQELKDFAGEHYDSLTEVEKDSIISELQMDYDFSHSFSKGGGLSDIKYISREAIEKIELKNGKIIENSWKYPIYSGVRVRGNKTEDQIKRKEMEERGQLSIFKKGGKLPNDAVYIPKSNIAKIYTDEGTFLGDNLVGGVWYNNEKAQKLIDIARKRGLLK